MAAPYAVLGSGYVLDDWYALANARFDGWWMAAGHDQWLARPGAGVLYALQFGLVGEHPLVAYLVNVVLMGVAAVLLYLLVRRLLGSDVIGFAVAAVWLVLPNHGSLLYWASAGNIALALVLLLAGLLCVSCERSVWGALLLGASVLCYEATGPMAVVGLVALAWRQRRTLLVGAAVLVPVAVWMIVFFHPDKANVHERADLTLMVPAHLGWGVLPAGWIATTAGTIACALAVATGFWARIGRYSGLSVPKNLVGAGIGVIVVGTVPFVRYFYAPLGAGDRVNVVASVGAALLWTGVGLAVVRWLRRPVMAVPVAGVFVVGFLVAGWQGASAWSRAGEDGRRLLATLPASDADGVVVVEQPPMRRNVAAFLDQSNIESAVQLRSGTRAVRARLRSGG